VALAIANGGGSILWTSGSTLLQRLVPDASRGRVAAAEIGGFMLTLSQQRSRPACSSTAAFPPARTDGACGLVALVPLAYWAIRTRAFQVTGRGAGE